jgi:hypothetical protein
MFLQVVGGDLDICIAQPAGQVGDRRARSDHTVREGMTQRVNLARIHVGHTDVTQRFGANRLPRVLPTVGYPHWRIRRNVRDLLSKLRIQVVQQHR